ncbi:MAG: transcriptional regulator, LysR family [Rhizobacter sp.]|nr:transcriptional regulator, LysR family [Rhizobacter sp.]
MDIARLKALRELSIRHTMTAVADALSLTPSAVSQQIAQLEEEAGIPLTERRGRGVKLTHAGEVLVSHAERIMVVLDEARSDLATIRKEIAGTLRVAAFATAAAAILPPVLQALRLHYPRLQITLVEMEPAEGLAALGSWGADLAIVDDLTVRLARMDKTVEQVPLIDDELRVVMATNHRLANKKSIGLAELKDEEWALDSATSFYGEFVLNLCRQAGYTPRVNAECRGSEIIAAMVASGCSVSIIPGLRLGQMTPHLTARPLRPEVRRRISVAFRRGERSHPAVRAFVDQLLQTAQSLKT